VTGFAHNLFLFVCSVVLALAFLAGFVGCTHVVSSVVKGVFL
jgi:hypothetical protein